MTMSQPTPPDSPPAHAPENEVPENEVPENEVTRDVGGVQGTPAAEDDAAPGADRAAGQAAEPGGPQARPAPDAGEIEWAGQLVKKPPSPSAGT
jgi:hypothetical protein